MDWTFGMGSGLLDTSASAQQMRQKIALAMLLKKTAAPKTFGEGLSSIGDAIGDRGLAARLEQEAAAQSARTDADIATKIPGAPPTTTTGPRAEAVATPVERLAEAVDSPAPAAMAAAPMPPVRSALATPPPGGVHPNVASWHGFATRPFEQGGLGVNPAQAAGIVGNLTHESGPQIKPAGVVGDNGTAFGAAQWRGDRYANLQGFARANGMDPMTTEAQQAFMRHEMRGSGPYGGGSEAKAFNALSAAPDPRAAATAFDRNYERSAGLTTGRRAAAAEQLARVMADPNATPRDRIAAVEAARTADTPPTPADTAQETRLGDVTGMRRAPPSFGATASLGGRTGDVQSDMPPVTGGLQGPLGQAVGDTVQARQDTMAPPPQQPPFQPPPPQQVAQAGANVFPPVVSAGGQPQAIIPGGGLPPFTPPAPQIQQAPPDPRAAIRTVPRPPPEEYEPVDRPQPQPPAKPGVGPIEADLTSRILNKDVDPRLKAAAAARIEMERAQLSRPYDDAVKKYTADIANWQKEQEQNRSYRMTRPKQAADVDQSRASTGKTQLESDKLALELGGLPAQLVQERLKREAEVGKAQSEAETSKLRADFEKRTGREREPFLKDFAAEKEQVSKIAPMLRDVQLAKEALNSGAVASGFGAEARLDAAKIAAKIGSKDERRIAEETEKYQKAMGRTISYAIMLVNGRDPRVTEGDVAMAKGNQGSPSDQEASKRKIIEVMQADLHGKVGNYEDLREQYLRGDPQHRLFKVDTPPTAPPAVTDALLKHRDDESIRRRYDADYGPGAAELEIKRAKRREQRAREDD